MFPFLAALALVSGASRLHAQNPAEIAYGSHGFVIGVVVNNGKAEPATFASGFFLDDRHIVTQLGKCCNAPQGVQLKGYVVSSHGQTSVAQPIWTSKEKIIAVFQLDKSLGNTGATLIPLNLMQQNQAVFGFGLKEGKPVPAEGTLTGLVSMKETNAKLLQVKLSGEVHQGSSLFDGCGNVAGLILGTGQGGDILALAVDEMQDAIAATKATPQMAGGACGGSTAPQKPAGGTPPGQGPGPGPGPGQKQPQQRPAQQQQTTPYDTLKYTLIVVAVLLVLAFSSRKGRAEVARVMTSRRDMGAVAMQPLIQPPGQYPGQFQGQLPPGQIQYQSPQIAYYPPGTRARLRGLVGYYAGSVVDLENRPWVLGRDQRVANIVFPAATETVSKKHCTIGYDPQRRMFILEDNGSTNGTWLPSGEALAAGRPRELYPGERFCVGDTGNMFEVVLE